MSITDRLDSYIPKGDGYNTDYAKDLEIAAQFIRSVTLHWGKIKSLDMGDVTEVTTENWEKIEESCRQVLMYDLHYKSSEKPF